MACSSASWPAKETAAVDTDYVAVPEKAVYWSNLRRQKWRIYCQKRAASVAYEFVRVFNDEARSSAALVISSVNGDRLPRGAQ